MLTVAAVVCHIYQNISKFQNNMRIHSLSIRHKLKAVFNSGVSGVTHSLTTDHQPKILTPNLNPK